MCELPQEHPGATLTALAPKPLIRALVVLGAAFALLLGQPADAGAPGTLDTSFGHHGKVITDFGRVDGIEDIAIQPDGKIVAVGDSWLLGTGSDHFALARYAKSGALDPTFGLGGKVTTDFGSLTSAAYGVALQRDGKIVVAGLAGGDIALARYEPDGSLDGSFGESGKVLTDLGVYSAAFRIVLQPDGKIVVAGPTREHGSYDAHPPDFVIARYTTDGTLDPSFAAGGVVITAFQPGFADTPYGVALAPGGKIVAAGTGLPGGFSGPGVIDIARYNADGSPDTTFAGDGALVSMPTDDSYSYGGVVVQPDSKIVVAGAVSIGGMALIRYTTTGALDPTFGFARGDVVSALGGAEDLVRQPDGKFVVAGVKGVSETNAEFMVARFKRSGALDSSFHGGAAITDLGAVDQARAVALQPDGKIVLGGISEQISNGFTEAGDFALARYVGVANCRVPSVVGKTLRAAKTAIARANCRVGRVGRRASASARGRVVSQRPPPGKTFANRSKIDLVVSRGRR